MPYDVHIHRGEDFVEAADNPIPREDWEAWVANAPDFRFSDTDYVEFRYDEGDRREPLAEWTGHPEGEDFALYYYAGEIVTGNPDPPVVRRMVEIADELGARLQGDDGEFYGPDGEPLPD